MCMVSLVYEIIYKKGVEKMTKVTVTEKLKDGAKTTDVEIEKMDMYQMLKVSKDISKVVNFINANDKVGKIMKHYNQAKDDVNKLYQEQYNEQKKQKIAEKDMQLVNVNETAFVKALEYGRVELLDGLSEMLVELPSTVFDILATASGISKEILEKQNFDTFMDVVDATVEVNDLQAIVNRIKKSKDTFSQVTSLFKAQA